ncbi:MAG: phosphoglycerate kinase [Mycoplasmataceae bacterium]|jgi:3-phosphoglycerate kinase|nr:phosphoglycerate kinase [Mycoplasmataceae bacterium]
MGFYEKTSYLDVDVSNKKVAVRLDFNDCFVEDLIINEYKFFANINSIKTLFNLTNKIVVFYNISGKKEDFFNIIKKHINFSEIESIDEISDINFKNKTILFLNIEKLDEDFENEKKNCLIINEKIDYFIFDAISLANSKTISTYVISKYAKSIVGPIVKTELDNINILYTKEKDEEKTFICGHDKIYNKIHYIQNMVHFTNKTFFVGGCCLTILKLVHKNIGKSFFEHEYTQELIKMQNNYANKIVLPEDFYGTSNIGSEEYVFININTNKDDKIFLLDIGENSLNKIKKKCDTSTKILFDGVLGVIEIPKFQKSTKELLTHLANYKKSKYVFICSNTLVNSLKQFGFKPDDFSYVSHAENNIFNLFTKNNIHALMIIDDKKNS